MGVQFHACLPFPRRILVHNQEIKGRFVNGSAPYRHYPKCVILQIGYRDGKAGPSSMGIGIAQDVQP